MIVRVVGGDLWLFDQRDHSELCGSMAAAWGEPPFEPVPEQVRLAAGIHDSGWPEWDERPRLDPATGWPHPYSRMPDADYHEIWLRGLARGWAADDLTGLLVSLHAMRFFGHKQRPEDRALHEGERSRQAEALRRLAAPSDDLDRLPDPFASWHAWMFFWDGLSLFLCEGWRSPWTSQQRTATGELVEVQVERVEDRAPGAVVEIRPYPFAGPLELAGTARVVPAAPFASQEELDDAVQRATRRAAHWTVRPAA
jgi:hypothetical protein